MRTKYDLTTPKVKKKINKTQFTLLTGDLVRIRLVYGKESAIKAISTLDREYNLTGSDIKLLKSLI